MGVDYYNCDICNEIYADCGTYESCQTCGASWCANCMDEYEIFMIDDEERCDLCFNTEPSQPSVGEILNLVLQKTGISKQDIIQELQQYQVTNRYYCSIQDLEEHPYCGSTKCLRLSESSSSHANDGYYTTNNIRGLCCVARFPEDTWCYECSKRRWSIYEFILCIEYQYPDVPKDIIRYICYFI